MNRLPMAAIDRRTVLVASTAALLGPVVAAAPVEPQRAFASDRGIVHVDAHGAKGDGRTDDLRSIRAAVAALPNGGTLVFTSGKTYYASATIAIGDRRGITIIATGATLTTDASTDAGAVLLIQNCREVRMRGGTLRHRGRAPRRHAADGLTVNHCSDVLVEKVHVGYVHSIGIRASGSSRVTITGCSVDGSTADGIGVYGGERQAAHPDGLITAGSRTLTSARSRFRTQDVGSTITVYGAGAGGTPLVTRIAAWRSRSQVTLSAAARTTVKNQFVKIQRPSDHVTIIGNTVRNTGDDAISSVGYRTYRSPNTDIVVRRNSVEGSRARGILLTGTSRGTISDNSLRRVQMGGIFLVVEVGTVTTWGSSDVVIRRNVVDTVGTAYPRDNYPGIGAASTDDSHPIRRVLIEDNIVRNAYSYYIGVGGYSGTNTAASTRGVTVRHNRCIGGNRNNPAIHVIKSTDVTIAHNTIAKPHASAVTVTSDVAGRIVVRGNVVSQYDRRRTGYPALDINPRSSVILQNRVNGVSIASGSAADGG